MCLLAAPALSGHACICRHLSLGMVDVCMSLLLGAAAATSGLEAPSFAKADNLANQMGLFLQKTNIIRDYLVSLRRDSIPLPLC